MLRFKTSNNISKDTGNKMPEQYPKKYCPASQCDGGVRISRYITHAHFLPLALHEACMIPEDARLGRTRYLLTSI